MILNNHDQQFSSARNQRASATTPAHNARRSLIFPFRIFIQIMKNTTTAAPFGAAMLARTTKIDPHVIRTEASRWRR